MSIKPKPMSKPYPPEIQKIFEEMETDSDVWFELIDLMDSLQGWCVRKMMNAKHEQNRKFLQALSEWAEEKDWK